MGLEIFHFDALSAVMSGLIGFIGLCVAAFSWRYLKGDHAQGKFFTTLGLMIAALFVLVSADHIALFLSAWAAANLLLIRLMVHKKSWRAARESGHLTFKHFAFGFAAMAGGFALLCAQTGLTSIQALINVQYDPAILAGALSLIGIGAMVQCGLWPFHRWLISSLNSPTPTSAIMHAGLINGGGFLLARLAPLYMQLPDLLIVLFVIGMVTALIGTLWKLMQSDVKRMLACSTMGQMGFMIAQCGLGLFPAAVAHLCWHGMFKAYLFLASGGVAQEKRLDLGYPPSMKVFALSLLCGLVGAWAFIWAGEFNIVAGDTTLFLIGLSFIAAAQLTMPILKNTTWKSLPLAGVTTVGAGALYGLSVHAFESLLAPMALMQPQELNVSHIIGFAALFIAWLSILFGRNPERNDTMPRWWLRAYVAMLNASQPHPKTITAHRNHYQYN